MAIRQLSIFLENRVGRLAAVAKALGDAGINIRGLSVADTKDFGILRLIVDDVIAAEKVLRSHDTVCQINDVTAVDVDNQPGGLAKVLTALNEAKVNVEYMYAIAEPKGVRPVMIFRFGEAKDVAMAALQQAGVHLYDEKDLLGK